MKVLIYGMQSSGASLLAYTLAQKPDCLAFIDVWNMYAAPSIETETDCVVKVVVTSAFSLELHKSRFRPDVTLLALRHPVNNYYSLQGKSYANESGLIDEKFTLLNETLRSGKGFDSILYYEDLVFSPRTIITLSREIGWKIGYESLLFSRSSSEIEKENKERYPQIETQLRYGAGNIHRNGPLPDKIRFSAPWGKTAHLSQLCPDLLAHYSVQRMQRADQWLVTSHAILSCEIHTVIRGKSASENIAPSWESDGYHITLHNGSSQCRASDTALYLQPSSVGRDTRLIVEGLPGSPFNRLRGLAILEHPLAAGTVVRIHASDANGEILAEQMFTLCHAYIRHFDLAYTSPCSKISLSFSVQLAGKGRKLEYSGVSFQRLRLEQVAI